ncbi:EAL domain-containing protein [Spongiibacter nanhainus]|nr:EAL domain-containing protein [Spongiibacter nanhainus]
MQVESLLNSLKDPVIGIDLDWRVVFYNRTAETCFADSKEGSEQHSRPLIAVGVAIDDILIFKSESGPLSFADATTRPEGLRALVAGAATAAGREWRTEIAPVVGEEGTEGFSLLMFQLDAEELALALDERCDSLTGLPGRREFELRLENLVDDAVASSRTHALLYVDIDQFKLINDTSGHSAGDNLIEGVAERLRTELFVGDVLCRTGGDEFAILLSNVDVFEARSVATRLVKAVRKMNFIWSGIAHRVSISVGVVLIDEGQITREAVMSQADVALFSAKDSGRGRVHVYDTQDKQLSRLHDDMDWVHRINDALSRDAFSLVTEKILPINDGKDCHYYELLVRMELDGELLGAGQFLPAAERFGLMPQIDRWVIKTMMEFISSLPQEIMSKAMFSINISGQSLCQEEFLEFVYRSLQRSNVDASVICFEITETVAITNFAVVTRFIQQIHELGGQFALDDFGTGMSSFAYLQELPVDFVKIDGLFVHDLDKNQVHEAMVRSINDICHVLGKRTIAEFVERPVVVERLRDIGVDFMQGHLYGGPKPLSDLQA